MNNNTGSDSISARQLAQKKRYTIGDLTDIMALLRSEGGCPWDREQTHKSIRSNFIEEVYEAVEAIDTDNAPLLREELGDVLLQVIFHSRISEESGDFNFGDIADELCRKLVVRHPHVFGVSPENEKAVGMVKDGVAVAETPGAVLENWDAIKKSMKAQKTLGEELAGVSRALPSLMRAAKLAGKAMKAGAYAPDSNRCDNNAEITEEELGTKLFELASLAKKQGIDPELALYNACERFIDEIKSVKSANNIENAR